MTLPNRPRYATRLNAFKQKGDTVAQMIAAAGRVGGLDAADLNFPDHFDHHPPAQLTELLHKCGMALNGLAMRYYTDPGFRLGAFTHPDATALDANGLHTQGLGAGDVGMVSGATFGSASILPISWMYVTMMGAAGLRRAGVHLPRPTGRAVQQAVDPRCRQFRRAVAAAAVDQDQAVAGVDQRDADSLIAHEEGVAVDPDRRDRRDPVGPRRQRPGQRIVLRRGRERAAHVAGLRDAVA